MPTLDAHALTDELDGLEALGDVLKRPVAKPKKGLVAVVRKPMGGLARVSHRLARLSRAKTKACPA